MFAIRGVVPRSDKVHCGGGYSSCCGGISGLVIRMGRAGRRLMGSFFLPVKGVFIMPRKLLGGGISGSMMSDCRMRLRGG